MRKSDGFTLIEVMIVVAIVAILAGVAYPSYQESIRKSRRAEARAQLLETVQYMQRFYSQNDQFKSQIGSTTDMTLPAALKTVPKAGTATYNIDFQTGTLTANSFTLDAVPTGVMTGDKCGTLRINNLGRRQIVGAGSRASVADCWK